jgi:hypothetical protein
LNTEVEPAKWKAIRLKNLPKGASVGLAAASSGTVDLIFIHQKVRLLIRALAPTLPGAKPSSPDQDRSKEKRI